LLCVGKASDRSEDLVHAHRFDPTQHGQKIDLASLDIIVGKLESLFVDENAGLVYLIRTFNVILSGSTGRSRFIRSGMSSLARR
jgi:hypothetical protein